MGGSENFLLGKLEPFVRDHSERARILIMILESGHLTVAGGQFYWGGSLDYGALILKNIRFYLAICWNIRFLYL